MGGGLRIVFQPRRPQSFQVTEDSLMDPHFNEYLAAIAGMHELYGEQPEDHPTEFHADDAAVIGTVVPVPAAA